MDPRLAALLARLRELPAEARPPYDWVEFNERAARSSDSPAAQLGWRHAAVAAGAAVAIIAIATWSRLSGSGGMSLIKSPQAQSESSADAQWHRPDIEAGWLESLPTEPVIVRADTHLGVMDLEDSIAWMDELITIERAAGAEPARVMELQRERSRLVDSLVRVRYAESLAAELP